MVHFLTNALALERAVIRADQIGKDLKSLAVVALEQAERQMGGGVVMEIGRQIANP